MSATNPTDLASETAVNESDTAPMMVPESSFIESDSEGFYYLRIIDGAYNGNDTVYKFKDVLNDFGFGIKDTSMDSVIGKLRQEGNICEYIDINSLDDEDAQTRLQESAKSYSELREFLTTNFLGLPPERSGTPITAEQIEVMDEYTLDLMGKLERKGYVSRLRSPVKSFSRAVTGTHYTVDSDGDTVLSTDSGYGSEDD
jgi:hypothetical protein